MDIAAKWQDLDPRWHHGQMPIELWHAGNGDDVALHISNAFASVRAQFERRGRITLTSHVAQELMLLGVRAEIAAHECFPKHFERDIHAGFLAFAQRILMWSEDPEITAVRPLDERTDAADRARILQNIAHNLNLTAEIEARAYVRRAGEIGSLITPGRPQGGLRRTPAGQHVASRCRSPANTRIRNGAGMSTLMAVELQAEADNVDELLGKAGAHLVIAAGGQAVAQNTSMALRAVLMATVHPDRAAASPELVSYLREAFELATPIVAEDASAAIPREELTYALGMAVVLMDTFGQTAEEIHDRQPSADLDDMADHAALLAAQLEALYRRQHIEERRRRARG